MIAEDVIVANEFILQDASGKTRAILCMIENEPSLMFFDANGEIRVILGMDMHGHGPALRLCDGRGKSRALLCLSEEGPMLALCDADEKPCVALAVDKYGKVRR